MGQKKTQLKELRKKFRNGCLERDNHGCRVCSSKDHVTVHHITDRKEMPNDGYAVSNGISLCFIHHLAAEVFHQTKGNRWIPDAHPDDLYVLIGSSKEKAVKDSEKLLEE
jgi:5-methylcytosine-specific restriction endonuclease McrA